MNVLQLSFRSAWRPALIAAGLALLYATVLGKLGYEWWTDDNYSHGLLVPFVVGYIIWLEFRALKSARKSPEIMPGTLIVFVALVRSWAGRLRPSILRSGCRL